MRCPLICKYLFINISYRNQIYCPMDTCHIVLALSHPSHNSWTHIPSYTTRNRAEKGSQCVQCSGVVFRSSTSVGGCETRWEYGCGSADDLGSMWYARRCSRVAEYGARRVQGTALTPKGEITPQTHSLAHAGLPPIL